jgi:AcrR family transcriptional regulator
MGSLERRERDRQELRVRILDAARELLVAKGYEAVTMRGIADRIEYSPAALYFHFRDKDALIRELIVNDVQILHARLRGIADIEDPIEQIREHGRVYVDFALSHPAHYRLIMMTEFPVEAHSGKMKGEEETEPYSYSLLRSAIGRMMEMRRLKRKVADPDLLVQSLWAGWHGVASLLIARGNVKRFPWRAAQDISALLTDAVLDAFSTGSFEAANHAHGHLRMAPEGRM